MAEPPEGFELINRFFSNVLTHQATLPLLVMLFRGWGLIVKAGQGLEAYIGKVDLF